MNFDVAPREDESESSSEAKSEFRSVDTILVPRSIAIVGVSDRGEGGWSKVIFDNLKDGGHGAKVYLINPRRAES